MIKRFRSLFALLIFAFTCACSKPTSISPTSTPTSRPTAPPTSAPTATSTLVVSQVDFIKATVEVKPLAKVARGSKEPFVIQVRVENTGPDRMVADVTATCSEDFEFFLLKQEPNQKLEEAAQTIVQEDVILEPKIGEQVSYKEVFFGFKLADVATVGTHVFSVQVNASGKDPVRASVVFEVTGTYSDSLPEVVLESFVGLTGMPYDAGETEAVYPGPSVGVRWLPALGEEDAPVTVIEFCYFSSYCDEFNLNTLNDLLREYVATGDVRYVSHFTGYEPHIIAEICAAEQGKYFAYRRAYFKDQGVETIEGLDVAAFSTCKEENHYQDAAADASRHALAEAVIRGTLTFVIRTAVYEQQVMVGYQHDEVRRVIDEALSTVREQ